MTTMQVVAIGVTVGLVWMVAFRTGIAYERWRSRQ